MGHQVNIRCKKDIYYVVKPIIKKKNGKYLKLDPKPGDFTIVRIVRQEAIYTNVAKFHRVRI